MKKRSLINMNLFEKISKSNELPPVKQEINLTSMIEKLFERKKDKKNDRP